MRPLRALRHGSGAPVCRIYGAHAAPPPAGGAAQPDQARPAPARDGVLAAPGAVGQGPTITFSVLRADGSFVGYQCAAPCLSLP